MVRYALQARLKRWQFWWVDQVVSTLFWIAMNFFYNIPDPQRMKPNDFCNPLTFHLVAFHLLVKVFNQTVNHLHTNYMDWCKIWYRHEWFLEDESQHHNSLAKYHS